MTEPTVFHPGDAVTWVGHPDHVPPPILEGAQGNLHGVIEKPVEEVFDLYKVDFFPGGDPDEEPLKVQVHADQIRHADAEPPEEE